LVIEFAFGILGVGTAIALNSQSNVKEVVSA
jgi:hypothetical protein